MTVRKKNTARFMLVGGKVEPGETPLQAAQREIAEEVGLKRSAENLELLGVFEAPAANEPDTTIHSTVFIASDLTDEERATLRVRQEIEELRFLDLQCENPTDIAPLLAQHVLPALRTRYIEGRTQRSDMTVTPAAIVAGEISAQDAVRPLSVFDMFRVGVGPSSSHTVGPLRAGYAFTRHAKTWVADKEPTRVHITLYGSLGSTGRGHWTDRAVLIGLAGYRAESVPVETVDTIMDVVRDRGTIVVDGIGDIPFSIDTDIEFAGRTVLPYHVNGLEIRLEAGEESFSKIYYSIGGGFVMEEKSSDPQNPDVAALASEETQTTHAIPAPYPFTTAQQLLDMCTESKKSISQVVWENEIAARPDDKVREYIDMVVEAMNDCIEEGCRTEGILPGGLNVRRRAAKLYTELKNRARNDSLSGMDWVNLWALAVNEENASGHRVVTAPTNGAAGVVPAVLTYYRRTVDGADEAGVHRFILAATAVGAIIKTNASIAGAEVGCQGEVGSAAAMAAAGLAEAMGGTPEQVENAAEIAMEHNLGLTCDPVGGLVQIPCIERNAIASVKAINAARMALWGDGRHAVSLDTVIETMRQTGVDMHSKYKETAEGGLAVNVVEC